MPGLPQMGISLESSDSSDAEILRSPTIKNRNDAAGGHISTQTPKVIPRVEITEDADADPRFRQHSERVAAAETNPAKMGEEDITTTPTEKGDANPAENKATEDVPTMEGEKAGDDQNTIAEILQESRQEVPPQQKQDDSRNPTKASGKELPSLNPKVE